MNVNELRNRILEISHNEVAPDTNLKTKALSWLNSAYHEIVSDSLSYLERSLEKVSVINMENGVGNLPTDLSRVMKVIDSSANVVLSQISQSEAAEMPEMDHVSRAVKYYWVDNDKIYTQPHFTGPLKLAYLRQVEDLEESTAESSIVIPKQFHYSLVWGGLVWSSIFERGFASQSDLKLFQAKWDDAKRELKLSLSSQPMKTLRVKPYDVP